MPTTDTEKEAPQEGQPESTPKGPDLVSKTPVKVAKKRSDDVVYSKSRRQKLGGAVTTVYLTTDGKFRVEGVDGADWGTYDRFSGKGMALEVARTGPPAGQEAEATEDQPKADDETEAEAA